MAVSTFSDGPCPDPSVHEKANQRSAHASTAALYATRAVPKPSPQAASKGNDKLLDADGKLASSSAATSLKTAKPHDLPSFPSHGTATGSAGKAAMLAKDYKMKDAWRPEQNKVGSKAAVLAHQGTGGPVERRKVAATSAGHSAATLAMRNKTLSPTVSYGVTAENKSKALLAATMSHNKSRQRAEPIPPTAPPARSSGRTAAPLSHGALAQAGGNGWDSDANQAARVKNSHMDRDMFTAEPPVEIERAEASHQAALRASALSMAKKMYEAQSRGAITAGTPDMAGAHAAASRTSISVAQPDAREEVARYINLQEAARKLAAERLAKVDRNLEATRYREYYGYEDKKPLKSRLSFRSNRGRPHRRAWSNGSAGLSDGDADNEQAHRIRSQMSYLNRGLSKVDAKKQMEDRAKLLATAEKRVSAHLHTMDEKVFADTGKVPPALMEQWEEKARERLQREREQQVRQPSKTQAGGGNMFVDQGAIEAIAAERIKPTLDEIDEMIEKRRAKDEELRLEREEQERQKREERARREEQKAAHRKVKSDEKAAAKREKDADKARKLEEKKVAKEEKRKSRVTKRDDGKGVALVGAAGIGQVDPTQNANAEEDAHKQEHERGDATTSEHKNTTTLGRFKGKLRKNEGESEDEGEYATPAHNASSVATTGPIATGAVVGATAIAAAAAAETADEHRATPSPSQHISPTRTLEEDEGAPKPQSVPTIEPLHNRVSTDDEVAPDATYATADEGVDEDVMEKSDQRKPGLQVDEASCALSAVAEALRFSAEEISEDDDDDSDEEDGSDADLQSLKADRPPFEQRPSLSGYHNDVDHAQPHAKPELERHISQIPESEDDESDYEGCNRTRSLQQKQPGLRIEENAPTVAERVLAASEPSSPRKLSLQIDDQLDNPRQDILYALGPPGVAPTDTASRVANAEHVQPTTVAAEPRSKETKRSKWHRKHGEASEGQERERKGFRGLFTKLRKQEPKVGNDLPLFRAVSWSAAIPYETTQAGETPTMASSLNSVVSAVATQSAKGAQSSSSLREDSQLAHQTGANGSTDNGKQAVGRNSSPKAESRSSFRRGETRIREPDDVSSSGVDEEELLRGRSGRSTRKSEFKDGWDHEGPGKFTVDVFGPKAKHEDTAAAVTSSLEGDLSSTQKAKRESPARGTRFQEQF